MLLRTRWFPRTEGLANALELSEPGVVSRHNAIVGNHGLSRRVYYTLYDDGKTNSQAHRNSKAIAVLIKMLREKGVLTDSDMDDMLLGAVM